MQKNLKTQKKKFGFYYLFSINGTYSTFYAALKKKVTVVLHEKISI